MLMVLWLECRCQCHHWKSAAARLVPLGRRHSYPCFRLHSRSELLGLVRREWDYHTVAGSVLEPVAVPPCEPGSLPLAFLEFVVPSRHCLEFVEASPGFGGERAVGSS